MPLPPPSEKKKKKKKDEKKSSNCIANYYYSKKDEQKKPRKNLFYSLRTGVFNVLIWTEYWFEEMLFQTKGYENKGGIFCVSNFSEKSELFQID